MIAGAATRLLLATTRRTAAVTETERGLQRIGLARTFAGRLGLLTTTLALTTLAALPLRTRTTGAGRRGIAERTTAGIRTDTLRTTTRAARTLGATGTAIAATRASTLAALTTLTAALAAEATLAACGPTLPATVRTTLAATEAALTTALAAWRLGEWQRVVIADVGTVEVRFVDIVLVVVIAVVVFCTATLRTFFRTLVLSRLGRLRTLAGTRWCGSSGNTIGAALFLDAVHGQHVAHLVFFQLFPAAAFLSLIHI